MRPASWVLAAALLVVAQPSRADDDTRPTFRAVIDRVELEPAAIGGQRLRIHMSALSLQGALLELGDARVKISVGGSELKAPYAIGRYAATGSATAIVFVVQGTLEFTDALPAIGAAIAENLVAKANERTQIAILAFGENVGGGKLGTPKAARAKATGLAGDGSAGEPALLDTLERALGMLKRAKTESGRPLRKLIVAIGDGRDRIGDRGRVTRLGERAGREGIPIHALGFTPTNVRRPLLTLGELAKRSNGTFRWVRSGKAESWNPAIQQLRDEIDKQYVITVFAPDDAELANKKVKIDTSGRVELHSNEHKIPAAVTCGGEACEPGQYCADKCVTPRTDGGRGFFGWILLLLGIAVGAVVVLGVIGFVMTKRQQQPQQQPPVPGVPKPPSMQMPQVPPPAYPTAPPAVMPGGPQLYVMTGPRAGETIALRHGFLIGKGAHCQLVIDDGYTSTNHAQIGMDDHGNCRIYDTGSTNGTFVNGVRVNEKSLEHGMTIRIGSTDLRFLAQ